MVVERMVSKKLGWLLVALVLAAHAQETNQRKTESTEVVEEKQDKKEKVKQQVVGNMGEMLPVVRIMASAILTLGLIAYLKNGQLGDGHYTLRENDMCPTGSFPFSATHCQKCEDTLLTLAPKDNKVRFLKCVPRQTMPGSTSSMFLSHADCWGVNSETSFCDYPMESLPKDTVTILPYVITPAKVAKFFTYAMDPKLKSCTVKAGWNYYSGPQSQFKDKPMLPLSCPGAAEASLVFTAQSPVLVTKKEGAQETTRTFSYLPPAEGTFDLG